MVRVQKPIEKSMSMCDLTEPKLEVRRERGPEPDAQEEHKGPAPGAAADKIYASGGFTQAIE